MLRAVLRRSVPLWIALCVAVFGLALLDAQARATDATPRSLGRDSEPVIVPGAELSVLHGVPLQSVFVYAHRGGGYRQIPFQVDHLDSTGAYTTTSTGILGPSAELVFMVSDLGDLPSPMGITVALPISASWYRIEVSDSLSPTQKGWAFIVRTSALTTTVTQTYASFDPATSRISTTAYDMGFGSNHPGLEYLALNGSGVDIVDRTKIRLKTVLGITLDEEKLDPLSLGLVANGPIRVIPQSGDFVAYGSMFQMSISTSLTTLPIGVSAARLSTDFSVSAVPATFYNANTPMGVAVDGSPDAIAPTPLSDWWQVSGGTGTLVQVIDASGTGGIHTNYYKDSDTVDFQDTGDSKSYGDTGVRVDFDSPGEKVVYHTATFVLPPDQPNIGERYAAYVDHPILVTVKPNGQTFGVHIPLTQKRVASPSDSATSEWRCD